MATQDHAYTPAQASAVTGLSLPAVHKAIEYKLIRPKRVREGPLVQRLLSKAQLMYLGSEAKGLRCLPLAARRQVARALERDPGIDAMALSDGNVLFIQVKSVRKEIEIGLRRLAEAERMAHSDPDIMRGAPVYVGTRIPVNVIADMLSQGASVQEILEGYPALTGRKIELATMYVKAFPRRGRPVVRPWAKRRPRRFSQHRIAS